MIRCIDLVSNENVGDKFLESEFVKKPLIKRVMSEQVCDSYSGVNIVVVYGIAINVIY